MKNYAEHHINMAIEELHNAISVSPDIKYKQLMELQIQSLIKLKSELNIKR